MLILYDFVKIPQSFFCSKKTTAPFTREPLTDSGNGCPYGRINFQFQPNFQFGSNVNRYIYKQLCERRTELFAVGKCLPVRGFVAYHTIADKISSCRFAIVLPSLHPLAASPAV